MSQSRTELRADLYCARHHARTVGDARFELDVEITIILYPGEDPDTGRKLIPPDTWRLAPDGIRRLLALDDGTNPTLRGAHPRQ